MQVIYNQAIMSPLKEHDLEVRIVDWYGCDQLYFGMSWGGRGRAEVSSGDRPGRTMPVLFILNNFIMTCHKDNGKLKVDGYFDPSQARDTNNNN